MSQNKPWDFDWPKEHLEYVSSCPVCGFEENNLMMRNLVDNVFLVAPGQWNLYQCKGCKSVYLNPRPDQGTIHKAYGVYYTHDAPAEDNSLKNNSNFNRLLWRMLANGYYNHHYGTRRVPSLRFGAWLLSLYPRFRKSARARFRYLPKPEPGQKLLDVGCGNGDFLSIAEEIGWQVKGVEPDIKALEVTRSRGLEVIHGSLDEIVYSRELFDVITMSHVIEHVHNPLTFVELAYECLKPGGILYVDTPNIGSVSAKRFGSNWRGIETPRHLVIFSQVGLESALKVVGFSNLKFFSRWEVRKDIALKSYRIRLGKSPYDPHPKRLPLKETFSCLLPRPSRKEEFLTVIAQKV